MLCTMNKARTLALLGLLLAGSLLTACGTKTEPHAVTSAQAGTAAAASETAVSEESDPPASGGRMITDELGHEVEIPAEPKNIFAPNMEDSLLKLGIKPVAQWSNGPQGHEYLQDELRDVPRIDFSGGLPSPEVLMSYAPDLIVLHTATYAKDGIYEQYAKIAPTYVFENASGNIEKSLATLGELAGKSAEAEQALQAYKKKVNEAKEKLSLAAGGKKVAIIRFAPRGVSLMGGNYLCGYVIHHDLGLGMSKLVEHENSANLSMEILPELDADYIFMINAYDMGTERMKEMTDSPVWKSIPAVKEGRVYEVDNKYWLGSGLIAYEKIIDDAVSLLAP